MKAGTVAEYLRRSIPGLTLLAGAMGVLFYPALKDWAQFCLQEDDFSHCLIIPLISGFLLFSRRREIAQYPVHGSSLGLAAAILSICIFVGGYLFTRNIAQRAGIIGALISIPVFLLGLDVFRRHKFAFLYLFLALPVPFTIHGELRRALQKFATLLSAGLLHSMGVPVINEENILVVDGFRLGVEDACSGIRSLMAIVSTAVLFCFLFRTGLLGGSVLVAISVPVTILVNIIRIVATAYVLSRWDIDLTTGAVHDWTGILLFGLSLALLYANWVFVKWLLKLPPAMKAEPANGARCG